jgi:hypothetical protein
MSEASRTAVRCNQVLRTFNVYYSSDECKLYRINTRAVSVASRSTSSSSGETGPSAFGVRSRPGMVRSDNIRTWVEE